MSDLVFGGKLKCGLSCEVKEAASFSGQVEVALEIGGQIVTIVKIETKKGGIECRVIESKKVRIEVVGDPLNKIDIV